MSHDGLLVIGYGNPLRGDDGVGPEVARRLGKFGFDALAVHQLTPEIAERIAAARAVFFLDADVNLPPGEISVEALHEAASTFAQSMEHYASPATLLRLAHEAYGAKPDAWYVAMGGSNFEIGEGLSDDARRAVSQATKEVMGRYER